MKVVIFDAFGRHRLWVFARLLEINTLAAVQDYVVILNLLSYFQIRSEANHWGGKNSKKKKKKEKKMLIP